MLINELNHRVKNTLATVQSIAINTLKDVSQEEARKALSSRLMALSRIYDILTARNWTGAELHDIVTAVRNGFGSEERISAAGPGIWLQPSAAMAMSLTLNELATNAVKYGALSTNEGGVTIRWQLNAPASPGSVLFEWIEHDGPTVAAPAHRGFGSRLIQSAFSGSDDGKTELSFEPGGLQCRIRIPPSVFTFVSV